MSKLQAVIFDLDGLMINSEPIQWQAMNIALEPLGIQITESEWITMVGRKTRENLTFLKKKYKFEESIADIEREKNAIYRRLIPQHLTPMLGLYNAIDTCKTACLRLALASSSIMADIQIILDLLGLFNAFEVIISGDQVTKGKPHPEIFLKTAQHLKVNPVYCLVLEDTSYGVAASKAAGMLCIAIPNRFTAHQDFSQADLILTSLAELDLGKV